MKLYAVPYSNGEQVWYCTKAAEAGGQVLVRACDEKGNPIKYMKHYTLDRRALIPITKVSPERKTKALDYLEVVYRGNKIKNTTNPYTKPGIKRRARRQTVQKMKKVLKRINKATNKLVSTSKMNVANTLMRLATPVMKTEEEEHRPASPSRFPYAERQEDTTRKDINAYFAKAVKAIHDEMGNDVLVLVLDHPASMQTSKALNAAKIDQLKIHWVNDEVTEMRNKGMTIHKEPNTQEIPGKALNWLQEQHGSEKCLYDAMFLDYCGQLETYKPDIRLALDQLWLGRYNQGAVFGVTFMFSRGGDSKEEISAWIEAVAGKTGMQACMMKSWVHGNHFTAFWNVRRNVSHL